jgi:hypothetical protein
MSNVGATLLKSNRYLVVTAQSTLRVQRFQGICQFQWFSPEFLNCGNSSPNSTLGTIPFIITKLGILSCAGWELV